MRASRSKSCRGPSERTRKTERWLQRETLDWILPCVKQGARLAGKADHAGQFRVLLRLIRSNDAVDRTLATVGGGVITQTTVGYGTVNHQSDKNDPNGLGLVAKVKADSSRKVENLILCNRCQSSQMRRATWRLEDVGSLLLLKYPVRCRACRRRQYTSVFNVFRLGVVPRF